MKLFYIASSERTAELLHDWHAIDLGNGKHLVCVRWRDEIHETHWSNHPDVIRLPHPIFESAVPLAQEHHTHLSGRYTLQQGDNVHHVIKKAALEDPWMRLHVL